jgi:subtilisin
VLQAVTGGTVPSSLLTCMQVISMSLVGTGSSTVGSCSNTATISDPQRVAVCSAINAGVTVVVAAGNSGSNLADFSPASYPEVLTVTAIADSDGKSGEQQQPNRSW